MTNEERWTQYMTALTQYVERTGTARVPVTHVEHLDGVPLKLGRWATYARQRRRAGLLSPQRVAQFDALPDWEWGPLRPGPIADVKRNMEIHTMRANGMSLQRIGDMFGLSRQRVHQIVRTRSSEHVG